MTRTVLVAIGFMISSVMSCRQPSGPPIPGASTPVPTTQGEIYQGLHTVRFEESSLAPCHSDDRWWMSGGVVEIWKFVDTHPEIKTGAIGFDVFVRVRGKLSPQGRYGHMGAYSRQLEVQQVLDIHVPNPADCQEQPGA